MNWLKNNWDKILALILSCVALGFSYFALSESRKANDLSKSSIEIANRPYLLFEPFNFNEKDGAMIVKVEKNIIKIDIQFKMTNVSHVPINQVCLKNTLSSPLFGGKTINNTFPITLMQGQSYYPQIHADILVENNQEGEKAIQAARKGDIVIISDNILSYGSEFTGNKIYSYEYNYKIQKKIR